MKIGIMGSGMVGQALAQEFIQYGYNVMITNRDERKANKLQRKLPIADIPPVNGPNISIVMNIPKFDG